MSPQTNRRDADPHVSVLVPVYGNQASLVPLRDRIDQALAERFAYEIVFVDDASPDGSRALLRRLADQDPRVRVIEQKRNRGQHDAVLAAIRHARGEWLVILDADLQDPPEAIPMLLARGQAGFDAVFAGRRGTYESARRTLTSRIYRALLKTMLPVPRDAGMFLALRSSAARTLLAMDGPPPQLVAMIGAARLRTASVPVRRAPRHAGSSAYTDIARSRSALRALRWALWSRSIWGTQLRRGAAPESRLGHNQAQRRYFEDQPKPNMLPRRSRYLERQVEELIAFAGLRAGDRVLEVGCGMGRYTLALAERGLTVTGIDIAPALLERLRSAAGRRPIELIEGDIVTPPPELEPGFDAVIGFFVLHHLHDLAACMDSIGRLVRPGGRVAFLEPNAYNPLYYAQIATTPSMTWEGDRGVMGMRRRPLVAALEGAGLQEQRLQRFGFFPPFIVNRPRGAALERRLEKLSVLNPLLPFQLIGARRP